MSEWDFRENPEDENAYETRGRWSTASKKKLNITEETEGLKMAKQRMKSEGVKIQTEEFRMSFPNLFTARAAKPGDKAKFGVTMQFQVLETEKSKKEGRKVVSVENLKEAVRNVLAEKFGADRSKWPPFGDKSGQIQVPFHDGAAHDKKDKPGLGEGIMFVAATKNADQVRPGVVDSVAGPDGKPRPIVAPSDIYGGCYGRATINPYFWEYMGKMGVSFGLQNVQKLRDGERFGGGTEAADDFDAIPAPTGATPAVPAAGAPAAAPAGAFGI